MLLFVLLLLTLATSTSLGAPNQVPQALFAHDNNSHTLLTVDTTTGAATLVGPTGFASGASGMAASGGRVPGPGGVPFSQGVLFGVYSDEAPGTDFITVMDVTTGTATKVVQVQRLLSPGRGIAFGPDGVTLYVVEGPSGDLSTLNVATGAVTLVGNTGFAAASLEWDPGTSSFFAVTADNTLIRINPATAASTIVGSVGSLGSTAILRASTLVRSPAGVWYTVNVLTGDLITINVSTGTVGSVIGNLGPVAQAPDGRYLIGATAFAPEVLADLAVTKTDDPDPAAAGSTLTYNLTVRNNGPSPATGVTLTDTLPAGVTFGSATPSQGSCTQAAGTVTCTIGNLASGASATVQIVVSLPASMADGTTLTNSAEVSGNEPDPNLANNTATEETRVVRLADLAVTKTDDPDPAVAGTGLTYTLQVTNNGPSDATGVTLTDTLPASVTFGSATSSQGSCTQAAGTVTCAIGDLAVGASATVEIAVTLDPSAPHGSTLTNTAEVAGNEDDPNPGNNIATEETQVIRQADLLVTKEDNPDPVDGGAEMTYTLRVSNLGPSTAEAVEVTDTLPSGATFQSASGAGWSCSGAGTGVTCTRPELPVGDAPPITVTVLAPTPVVDTDVTNTVTVGASTPDPNPGNNTDTEITRVIVPPPGSDKLTARVFIDFGCDGYFQGRLDVPLAGVPVKVKFLVNGASTTLLTTSFGMVYFAGYDVSGGVEVSVSLPADYHGYPIGACLNSPTTVTLGAGDFVGSRIRHAHIDFRAEVLD